MPKNDPSYMLVIDPGFAGEGNAVGLFEGSLFVDTWFEHAAHRAVFTPHPRMGCIKALTSVVVEQPEYQGARTDNARAQDSIKLSWAGGVIAAMYAAHYRAFFHPRTPSDWKQSQRKPQMHLRLWDVLKPSERKVLGGDTTYRVIDAACEKGALDKWRKEGGAYYPRSFKRHNQLDVAALGCVVLGRMT